MITAPDPAPQAPPDARRIVERPRDAGWAAAELAAGAVVGAAFANFYALVARPDEATVRSVNVLKGRPPDQVGSVTAPPSTLPDVWDLDALPPGLAPAAALEVVDAFLDLGPFGFRGPARSHVPAHLTAPDSGVTTAQLIAPGRACPSNDFLQRALDSTGAPFLYVTSANRSRHATGADDSPAHWRGADLVAEFGHHPSFRLLEHADEAAARQRYPQFLPMSTSVLALHRTTAVAGDRRPHLVLERHGSLPATVVRSVLAGLGFGLVLGPRAGVRLQPRRYGRAG